MLYDKRWDAKIAPRESKLVEQLKLAREKVATAWCQRSGSKPDGSVCAFIAITGSVSHPAFLRSEADDALDLLKAAIRWDNIPGWNDAPGRTQAEVVAAFDRAIELARK